jgi:hypothetical protein
MISRQCPLEACLTLYVEERPFSGIAGGHHATDRLKAGVDCGAGHHEHHCSLWRTRRAPGDFRRMWKFGAYLANWNKPTLRPSLADSAAIDRLSSVVWAIAHLLLRS